MDQKNTSLSGKYETFANALSEHFAPDFFEQELHRNVSAEAIRCISQALSEWLQARPGAAHLPPNRLFKKLKDADIEALGDHIQTALKKDDHWPPLSASRDANALDALYAELVLKKTELVLPQKMCSI